MAEQDNRATILVVDDERGPRESLRMILEPVHRVLQAASGAEALETLRTQAVDLLTLDLNMPGMNGQDVMRTVRRDFPQIEVVVITGCGSVESAAEGIRYGICDYLQKPFDVVQVGAAVTRALTRQRARARLTSFLGELGEVVGHERNAHVILEDVQRSQKLRGRLGDLFERIGTQPVLVGEATDPTRTAEFLEVLAETIENKDQFMRGHARRVAFYSSLLADRLNLSAAECDLVRISAFLHDLGKVGVPTDLLLRDGRLDSAERAVVERHPEIGARLIKPLDIKSSISLAIRHHHERWDGSGYPDGLAGEEIPFVARVIGITDAFDAMTCDRPYRPALTRELVCRELRRHAGKQFDPDLAKEFLAVLETGISDVDPEFVADALGQPALAGALRVPRAVSAG
jgi:response regulator RpfG family c-di-GMP phosphodiesterase